MKVKTLLKFLEEELKKDENFSEKEINFFDFKNSIAYGTPKEVVFVDLSDEKYFDLVFNYEKEEE